MTDRGDRPADWYADPYRRHELRYWDGDHWSEHVSSQGRVEADPVTGAGPDVSGDPDVRRGTVAPLTERVLLVAHHAEREGSNGEQAVYDRHGVQTGALRRVHRRAAKELSRGFTEGWFTRRLQFVDMGGSVLLQMHRSARIPRISMTVSDGMGEPIGEVVQKRILGDTSFDLLIDGESVASTVAENRQSWEISFCDADDVELARITKVFPAGIDPRFGSETHYAIIVEQPLGLAVHRLVLAAALGAQAGLR